ncbi:thiamine diphosphokinase [Granulicatella balaenopterae]|nr:thiamine diphosphokinase [Granulicatella balaenopterae]
MMKKIFVVIGGPDDDVLEVLTQYHTTSDLQEGVFVGVDGGCPKLIKENLPIDFAIGDFDSVSVNERQRIKEYAQEMIQLPCEKDVTDFEAALAWCVEHYPMNSIHILGAFGGRIDHQLSIIWIANQVKFQKILANLHFESLTNYLSFLLPGQHQLQKYPNMKYLSFITMNKVTNVSLKNVKYPLDGVNYDTPVALISNEFLTDTMTISFDEGLMITCQTNDK